jgi:hypothetical protein
MGPGLNYVILDQAQMLMERGAAGLLQGDHAGAGVEGKNLAVHRAVLGLQLNFAPN